MEAAMKCTSENGGWRKVGCVGNSRVSKFAFLYWKADGFYFLNAGLYSYIFLFVDARVDVALVCPNCCRVEEEMVCFEFVP